MRNVGLGLIVAAVIVAAVAVLRKGPGGEPGPSAQQTTTVTTTTSAPSTSTAQATTLPPTTTAPNTATPPREGPLPGGRVVVAGDLFATTEGPEGGPSLNPFLDGFVPNEAWTMGSLVWMGATATDRASGRSLPALVTEIPTPDNGGVEIAGDAVLVHLHIRDEAVWEDGTLVTTEDFVFTHDVITDARLAIRDDWRQLHGIVLRLIPEGDKDLTVELRDPDFRYVDLFPIVLPAHQIRGSDFAADWNESFWLSASPFRYVSHESDAPAFVEPDEYVFARNPESWLVDAETGDVLPYLDEVVFRFYQPDEQGLSRAPDMLAAGEVDIALGVRGDAIDELVGREGVAVSASQVSIWEHADFQFRSTRFEANPDSVVDQLAMRRAVAQAIDREALVGGGEPVDSIIELYLPTEDTDVWSELHPHDPEAARDSLAQLAASALNVPSLVYTSSIGALTTRIGNSLIDQLREAGIEAEADYGDFFFDAFPARRWELAAWRWLAEPGESALFRLLSVYDPRIEEEDGNFGGWSGDRARDYAALLDEAQKTFDPARRIELWKAAERVLAEELILIPLVTRGDARGVGYRHDRVVGVTPAAGLGGEIAGIERWWLLEP